MLEVKPLKTRGIHDVFDDNMENSYRIIEDGETLGYVCYFKSKEKKQKIWVEFLLAVHRGRGDGETMLRALFEKGFEQIEGTAIYGPHFFWESMGAVFEDEVEENVYDGTYFCLTKENFYKGR